MRKKTTQDYQERINEVLFCIHKDIAKNHSVISLAKIVSLSAYHFNRVFKSVVGENLHQYIRRVRLEYAANSLLFHPNATVSEILQDAGFSSNASFTHAFKECFGVTPTKWREVDIPLHVSENIGEISDLHVELCYFQRCKVAYVRHKGYNRSIKKPWQRLKEWCYENSLDFDKYPMLGLHHSNPNIVKKEDCHYVACLVLDDDKEYFRKAEVGIMEIPRIFCAKFVLSGRYGDLMKYMDYIYYKWLPSSAYEKVHLPSMARYHKNHFIREDEEFELEFYVPVRFK